MTSPIRDSANPYAAPESNLSNDASAIGLPGGTLEQTLAGQNNWKIREIIDDCSKLVTGFKGTAWLAAMAYAGAAFLSGIAEQVVAGATGSMLLAQLTGYALTAIVLWPLMAGIQMLGVRRAAGMETRVAMIGDYFPQVARIAGLSILQTVLIVLGMMLLVIPGIYLAVSYVIAMPLLVDRKMGIWESLETSRRAIGTCWFRTAGLMSMLSGLSLVGVVTLGIGLIWIVPLAIIAWGMLYHRLAGYSGGVTE